MGACTVIIWVVSILLISGGIFYGSMLPKRSADIDLDFGEGTAKIFFEENGFPHIQADNENISGFALGYIHAADRLWQIDFLRRIAQGRISEIFGKAAIDVDKAMRVLDLRGTCETHGATNEYYENYVRGINEYVKRNNLPIHYKILQIGFHDYDIVDICTILKVMFLFLNHNWGVEIARDYILALTKDEELMNNMFTFDPEYFDELTTYIMTDNELKQSNHFFNRSGEDMYDNPRVSELKNFFINEVNNTLKFAESFESAGSNSWVISGNYTKNGKPILVNDPHLSNSIPSAWHISHTEYPNGDFRAGASIPGVGIYFVFSTNYIVGGLTNIISDNSDVFEEKIKNGKYLYKGEYYPLEIRKETIKVKNEESVEFEVESTRNGPLINENYHLYGNFVGNHFPIKLNGTFSLKWTGMDKDGFSTLLDAYNCMNSKTVQEIIDIQINSTGVTQNLIFADTNGNIALIPVGSFVKRDHPSTGNTISRGWEDDNKWLGYVNGTDRPYLLNPEKQYIVAANNVFSSPNVKYPISAFVPSTARSTRITHMIQEIISRHSNDKECIGPP